MMWATGFTSTTKVVSCRTGPGKILGPLPLTRFILLVTPVRCIGSGVWSYVLFLLHLFEADTLWRDVTVGLHQSQNKNNCITSILAIPHHSDWWMRLRQDKRLILLWAVQQVGSSSQSTGLSHNWVYKYPKKCHSLLRTPSPRILQNI